MYSYLPEHMLPFSRFHCCWASIGIRNCFCVYIKFDMMKFQSLEIFWKIGVLLFYSHLVTIFSYLDKLVKNLLVFNPVSLNSKCTSHLRLDETDALTSIASFLCCLMFKLCFKKKRDFIVLNIIFSLKTKQAHQIDCEMWVNLFYLSGMIAKK